MKTSEFNLLSLDEQKLFQSLKNLRGGGMWGDSIRSWFNAVTGDDVWKEAINNQVEHGSAEGFRHLIQSLQSQASDNPKLMLLILGEKTYNQLMALEPVAT